MNILYLTDADLAPHKAPQIHVSQFLKHWHRAGCKVLLRAPRTRAVMPEFEFPHTWLPHSGVRLLGDMGFQWRIYRQLKRELKQGRWDVVYTRQVSTFPALYRLCRRFSVPVLCEVNGFLLDNYKTGGASSWKLSMIEHMESSIVHNSNIVVVPYPALKERMCQQYVLPGGKVMVVENGVDLEKFHSMERSLCRQSLGLSEDSYLVGFVGSFDFYHDIDTMIQAYPSIAQSMTKRLEYVLVGDGVMRQQVECMVQAMGLSSQVHFVGAIPNMQVPQYINACDVMVSLQPLERMKVLGEASSLKVKEYLACNATVILSHIETQVSCFEGLCVHVEPEQVEQFSQAVIKCYEGRYKLASAQSFIHTCSWQSSALNLLNVMKKMVG